jgi:hypothetical protein
MVRERPCRQAERPDGEPIRPGRVEGEFRVARLGEPLPDLGGPIGVPSATRPYHRGAGRAEPRSVAHGPPDIFIAHVPEYPAQHQHVRWHRVAISAGDPGIGLKDIDPGDARRCDAITRDADIVVVGLDEQCVHVGRPRVTGHHADHIVPLPGAGADDADGTGRRLVDRVDQTSLDCNQTFLEIGLGIVVCLVPGDPIGALGVVHGS